MAPAPPPAADVPPSEATAVGLVEETRSPPGAVVPKDDDAVVGMRVPPGVAPEDADVGCDVVPADASEDDAYVGNNVAAPAIGGDVPGAGEGTSVPPPNVVGGVVPPDTSEDANVVGDVVVSPDASEDDNVVGNIVPAESTDDGEVGTLVVPGEGAGEEPSSTGQLTVSAGKACIVRG